MPPSSCAESFNRMEESTRAAIKIQLPREDACQLLRAPSAHTRVEEEEIKKRKVSAILNPTAARRHVHDSSFVLQRDKKADQEGSRAQTIRQQISRCPLHSVLTLQIEFFRPEQIERPAKFITKSPPPEIDLSVSHGRVAAAALSIDSARPARSSLQFSSQLQPRNRTLPRVPREFLRLSNRY